MTKTKPKTDAANEAVAKQKEAKKAKSAALKAERVIHKSEKKEKRDEMKAAIKEKKEKLGEHHILCMRAPLLISCVSDAEAQGIKLKKNSKKDKAPAVSMLTDGYAFDEEEDKPPVNVSKKEKAKVKEEKEESVEKKEKKKAKKEKKEKKRKAEEEDNEEEVIVKKKDKKEKKRKVEEEDKEEEANKEEVIVKKKDKKEKKRKVEEEDNEEEVVVKEKKKKENKTKVEEAPSEAPVPVLAPALSKPSAYDEGEKVSSSGGRAFQRVKAEEWLGKKGAIDNRYEATFGDQGWGYKAQQVLGQVRGKDFRHEKTKKKRGSYMGGLIDPNATFSTKFDSDDE
jgi:hypothetical protein